MRRLAALVGVIFLAGVVATPAPALASPSDWVDNGTYYSYSLSIAGPVTVLAPSDTADAHALTIFVTLATGNVSLASPAAAAFPDYWCPCPSSVDIPAGVTASVLVSDNGPMVQTQVPGGPSPGSPPTGQTTADFAAEPADPAALVPASYVEPPDTSPVSPADAVTMVLVALGVGLTIGLVAAVVT